MLKQFFKFLRTEWQICLFYSIIILVLNGISVFYANGKVWINIILFIVGFGVFSGFIITASKLIRNDSIGNKFNYMILGKDKMLYDIIILLVFFSVILIPFKGLLAILTVIPFGKNILATVGSTPPLAMILSVLFLIISCMYKTAIYSGLANLVHNKKEVLESFKYGAKNILNMYPVFLILIISSMASIFLLPLGNNVVIKTISNTFNYILPGFLVLLVFCDFEANQQLEKLEEISPE